MDFTLFEGSNFHSEFRVLEVSRHTPLTDKLLFLSYELPKTPPLASPDDSLLLWLSLFKAKNEADLQLIENMGAPEMSEAIGAYRSITVSPEFKEAARLREKARHDEAQAMLNERIATAYRGIELKLSDEDIAKLSLLTVEEIRKLRQSDM